MFKEKTFWPYGILLSIFGIILACVATIIFASNYPVYEDDFYLGKYQNVDYNFNEIQQKQANFDKLFKLVFLNNKTSFTGQRNLKTYEVFPGEFLKFRLEKLDHLEPQTIEAEILLTRPHQNTQDQVLNAQIKNELLSLNLPNELEKGRWQLKLKLRANDEAVGFHTFELRIQ